jgi:hypothetical protein
MDQGPNTITAAAAIAVLMAPHPVVAYTVHSHSRATLKIQHEIVQNSGDSALLYIGLIA